LPISIVVPVLNEADTLEAALGPLAALRASGHELIVVDGGSRDTTVAIATCLADRVVTAPQGRAAQMNAGAAVAHYETLLFLHADTRLPQDADRLIAQAVFQGAHWGRFDVTIEGKSIGLAMVSMMMNLRSRWSGIATGDQAIFVRRAVFEAAGGFPQIALMEDIALSSALKMSGPPACLRAKVITSGRRWDRHGLWRTIMLMWRLRFAYWRGASPDRLAAIYYGRGAP
jgi:rSAM/selenodomain-associated transferase 2